MAIRFDTEKYFASHGKEPRGRGGWMFTSRRYFADGEGFTFMSKWNSTYTEAKKQAVAQLRKEARTDSDSLIAQVNVLYTQP